ncbi:hypothetical protein BU15DRAFT_53925 [Melanogaster broomeanus]|nr:hypothetical protein BU15DRAFT_53925 [Melanogaster broomeanus]
MPREFAFLSFRYNPNLNTVILRDGSSTSTLSGTTLVTFLRLDIRYADLASRIDQNTVFYAHVRRSVTPSPTETGFTSVLTSLSGTGAQNARNQFTDYSAPEPLPVPRQDQPLSGFSYDRLDSKRRQTLRNLLNVLNELSQSDTLGQDSHLIPSFEDDRDAPTADEQLQVAGAEVFNRFHKRIDNLDKELRNFANAARQLGSSVGILSTAFRLRERIARVLFLFRENAADLFPRKVARQQRETLVNPNVMEKRRRKNKAAREGGETPGSPPASNRPNADDFLDIALFPEHLEAFAADVVAFLNCLNEFPEFTDEAMNTSIRAFEGDLKYWACCLDTYKGQFKYPAVQRYIHDLTSEMGEHIDSITSTLIMFIEVGVPTIRFAQKHGASNLLTLSTVATFFSAVTATTLQFSYSSTSTVLAKSVNAFWFSSLVFSIAAAVNSLLGLSWKMAMYRSPGHRVPWWVLIWIKRSPLVFLVMSVACFSAGLVLFTYATGQGKITSTITSVFTAFTSFGLAAVSLWFASERWTFVRFRGQKWLQDVLAEWWGQVVELVEAVMRVPPLSWVVWLSGLESRSLARPPSLSTSSRTAVTGTEKDDSNVFPNSMSQPSLSPPSPPSPFAQPRYDSSSRLPRPRLSSTGAVGTTSSDGNFTGQPVSPRDRFTHAIRSVIMLQSGSPGVSTCTPVRKRTTSSAITSSSAVTGLSSSTTVGENSRGYVQGTSGGASDLRSSRLVTLIPKLRSLSTAQEILAHSALVRHLQFSPNGKFLATSSWDRTSIIFKVELPLVQHRILAHPSGFVGQVAWSPFGNLLLTKLNRVIKMWTEASIITPIRRADGVCRKTIDRHCAVQAVTWIPSGEAFMSVEGSEVVKLVCVLDRYAFHRVLIHDVAVTPDSLRLLAVGPIMASPTGLQPSKSRVEKQFLVYNMETKLIENQTPVLNDVRDITLARNGQMALISYDNKAPPQLWKLDVVKDRMDSTTTTARLSLRHTYMPKMPVDFAGHSYFGGKEDQLVLCAGKAGDIHIWDRDSAVLLHHVRAQALGGDLTCIAWNQSAENPFMFATGSHDGGVRVWTTSDIALRPQEQAGTVRSTPCSVTPRAPSPKHFGMRADNPLRHLEALVDDFGVGSVTSQPLTMSPEEESDLGDRSVMFVPSKR